MAERFRIRLSGRAMMMLAFWLLVMPLRWVMGMMVAIFFHEMGHIVALWCLGIPLHGIEVDFGGAVIHSGGMEPEEELICALAGPVAGALVCMFGRWMPEAALCAFVQTVFNLLPVYPMDGGRVIRAARNICCKPGEKRVQ